MGQMHRTAVGAVIVASLFLSVSVDAKLSLSVRFPDVELENVEPGSVINLRQRAGVPYVVINGSDASTMVDITAEIPTIASGSLREGFEPIPHPEWVQIVPNRFKMAPGDIASGEVILSVPDDPQLIGRHFQVDLRSATDGPGMLAVAVKSYLMFTVGAAGPANAKKEKRRRTLGKMDLDLTPSTVRCESVALGQPVSLKALKGVVFKVTNRGNDPVQLKLTSVRPNNSQKEEGWSLPDPTWLTLKSSVLKIKPDQIKGTEATLLIPDVPENRGKKFMFLIESELDGMNFPLGFYSRVFVTTEP